jgi:hypothetical protein
VPGASATPSVQIARASTWPMPAMIAHQPSQLGRDLAETMIRPAQSEIAPVATQLFANDRLPRSKA